MDGLEVTRHIRKESDVPILIVTARSSEGDKLLGLEIGADDYITKPFSTAELVARVRALLRRSTGTVTERVLEIGALRVDPARRTLERDGALVPLTTLEFDLLYFLASRAGRVFTREALMEQVWGSDRVVDDRSIDSLISRVRRKLEQDPEIRNTSRPSGARAIASPRTPRDALRAPSEEPLLDHRGDLPAHRGRGHAAPGLVVSAVLQPMEEREARARAELAASGLATAMASAPQNPSGAALDSLLARHREAIRPAWIVYRKQDGTVVTSPPDGFRGVRPRTPSGAPPRSAGEAHGRARQRDAGRGPDRATDLAARRVRYLRARHVAPPVPGRDPGLGLRRARAAPSPRAPAPRGGAPRHARGGGDLSVRIADKSGDEIGRLAEQLDRMTERLSAAREQLNENERERRQLFADITHELATPLTSIRGYAETLLDPAVPVSAEERTHYVRGSSTNPGGWIS